MAKPEKKQVASAASPRSKSSRKAPAAAAEAPAAPPGVRITGKVVLAPLESVKPNTWNPNRMTEFQVESTRAGLLSEGWLAAYALLVWGTDEKGKTQNIIIDGEHRWRIARDLGFPEGPMVFLEGVSARRAKEMTIEFDSKRGKFDNIALRELIADIGVDDGLSFRLGIDADSFAELMKDTNVLPPEDFSEVSIDAKTDYTCPKCGYEWSGGQKGKKAEAEPPSEAETE
jgi:hypothetical protein